MKKTFIIGLIIFLFGGVLLAIGLGRGGFKAVYWDNGIKIDAQTKKSTSIKDVKKVKISGGDYGSVLIHEGSEAKVTINGRKSNQVKTKVDGDQLTVSGSHSANFMFGDLDFNGENATVEITVPKKTQIQTIDVDGYSSVHINNLTVKNLTNNGDGDLSLERTNVTGAMTTDAGVWGDLTIRDSEIASGFNVDTHGDVTIMNTTFKQKNSRLQTNDGDIFLRNNNWQTVGVETSDGDVSVEDDKVKGSMQVSSGDGDINAHITPNKHTVVTAKSGDGDVLLFGKSDHRYGKASADAQRYGFTSSDGDITVQR